MPKKSTKRGRGRPAHVPTQTTRRQVSILAGGGMRHEDIAITLSIGRETLRKYYEEELSVGANRRRADVLAAMYKAAVTKGSVTAAKAYLAVEPELAVPPLPPGEQPASPAPAAVAAPVAPAPDKPTLGKTLGKKEQAALDATTAQKGTGWDGLLPDPGTPIQ